MQDDTSLNSPIDPGRSRVIGQIRGWLIDLDGVIYRGEQVVDGAADFVELLRNQGTPYLFLTNNSTRTLRQYADRLCAMGIPAEPDEFYTSALATVEYLTRRTKRGTRVLMIGKDGLREALLESGFELVQAPDAAEYCVVGFTNQVTYDELKRATLAIRAGARFIATNPDPTLPVEEGLVPGVGAILAAIITASDVRPTVIGKPEPIIIALALERLGLAPGETAILGDRLDTDILGGKRAGLITVLTLTGSSTEAELAGLDYQPDLVVRDMSALIRAWQERPGHLKPGSAGVPRVSRQSEQAASR